ncbi:MAG: pyruvate kinase [Clostridia bacterium]|nr:pyruvate kinase [Clostridia bacterium]
MRKTKIVCTLGPATDNEETLRQVMLAGMDVARINFSHGTHEEQQIRIDRFKKLRKELNLPIALLLDTKGPEIRIKTFENNKITLNDGEMFTLTIDDIIGNSERVSVTYKNLVNDIKIGDRILMDDGLIELSVVKKTKNNILCEIITGGELSNNKSINLPDGNIHLPYMSQKDREDIIFGIKNDFDFIAASFVRSAYDVMEVKKILEENDGEDILIISKIENGEGVDNIDEILKVSNGIMVARGDMGVEIPFEKLPAIQKMIIEKCYKNGKMVITATQMLDSMIRNPRPTRAETTDIANAIYDGTSAIMLSGETAAGKYPVESIKAMSKIAEQTELSIDYKISENLKFKSTQNVTDAISHATCTTANDLGASAIIAITLSGFTARMVSKFRPDSIIIAATPSEKTMRQLKLSWGVYPIYNEIVNSTDDLFVQVVEKALETGYIKNGDLAVITAGIPLGTEGTTNMIKVHLVGQTLASGKGVNDLSVSGSLCVAKSEEEAIRNFKDGDILVVKETSNTLLPIMKNASGIITEQSGSSSHAAIVGLTLDIPVIVGVENATNLLDNGALVTLDANRGLVYCGITKVL